MDEHTRGRGVNVSSYDIAEDAAALRVDHDGVVHDRVVMLVVDQPVDAQRVPSGAGPAGHRPPGLTASLLTPEY